MSALVTGIGHYTALGDAQQAFLSLQQGQGVVTETQLSGVKDSPSFAGAAAKPLLTSTFLKDRKLKKYMNQTTAMAVEAAGRALQDAGLLEDTAACAEMALIVSTGLTALDLGAVGKTLDASRGDDGDLDLRALGSRGLRLCHPLMAFKTLLNMPLGLVSMTYGIRGPNFVTYPGARQSSSNLEIALRGIRRGRFDICLLGASAQQVSLFPFCSRQKMGLVAHNPDKAWPFTAEHNGLALADGAVFLVLESAQRATRRGASFYAKVDSVQHQVDSSPLQLWHSLAPAAEVDLLLLSASVNQQQDQALLDWAKEYWQNPQPLVSCFDGYAGVHGVAGLGFNLSMAALMIKHNKALATFGGSQSPRRAQRSCQRVLVSVADGQGAHAGALLSGEQA